MPFFPVKIKKYKQVEIQRPLQGQMSSWWPLGQLQQRSYRVARFTEALRVDRLPLPSDKVFRWSEISLPGGRFLSSTLLLESYINKYRRNLVHFCNSVRQKVYLGNGVFSTWKSFCSCLQNIRHSKNTGNKKQKQNR